MRLIDSSSLILKDNLDFASLKRALRKTIVALQKSSTIPDVLQFGSRSIPKSDYLAALQRLEKSSTSFAAFLKNVKENFDAYEAYGGEEWAQVLVTGYFEPIISGSDRPNKKYSQALYETPNDLVVIDIGAYADRYPELEPMRDMVIEQKSRSAVLRGRIEHRPGREDLVTPYYDRAEIDGDDALKGKRLEIAYVDPVDAFFLQIQGSGLVRLTNGKKIKVGYAAQNGAAYIPIGRFLLDRIPLEEMSMQRIRSELASMSELDRSELLFQNPSYVFFKKLPGESITYSGAETEAGRTIATDQSLFPKGALAYLQIDEPRFVDPKAPNESHWESAERFVFDQDTGGAIRGGGRVDLYFGQGDEAGRRAGVMKREGRLYYFVPKE